jgi:hypothetical protein
LFRLIQSSYAFASLAPARNGNRRSGWHQQIVNTEKNGLNGSNGDGKRLPIPRTASIRLSVV